MLGGNQGCRGVRCRGRGGRLLPRVAGGPSGPVHVPLGASVCSPRRGPPTRSGRGRRGSARVTDDAGSPAGALALEPRAVLPPRQRPASPRWGRRVPLGVFSLLYEFVQQIFLVGTSLRVVIQRHYVAPFTKWA